MVHLRDTQVHVLPGQAALDAVIEVFLAGDHVALKDPVQGDGLDAQVDDLITHLQPQAQHKVSFVEQVDIILENKVMRSQFFFRSGLDLCSQHVGILMTPIN